MSTHADIERFVLDLITRHGPLPEGDARQRFNYVDSGHVDSMGVMDIVVAVEDAFDLELRDSDIMADAFRTVGGLIDTIVHAIARGQAEAAA